MWISGKHLVLYLFDCGVHLIDTSTGGGVWETWTKHPMKHFFKCLKNPSVFSRGIFQVLKKVVQGQQHLISQGLIALGWWQKTLSKMHFDEAKSIRLRLMLFCLILMHFALCFLPSSLCNALGWWQKPLSKMHSDVAKKHSASPHAFLPHPHAFCFVIFVIILVVCTWMMTKALSKMHSDEAKKHSASPHAFLPHPHAFCFVLFVIILVHSWDIKCCCPWATFFNTWKIPLEKTLGFFKHLKKCFMGCLVQVSQTPPPAEVCII